MCREIVPFFDNFAKNAKVWRTGKVAEWSKAPHSKCGRGASSSRVRIPPFPQNRKKREIVQKRRKSRRMWRTARHSSPDPSCRAVRIFLGVFGKFIGEGEGGAGSRHEGAVAEESDSHRLVIFIANAGHRLEAAHFRFSVGSWRAQSICPYGSRTFHRRFVATVGCSAVPTSAGRGQKSVRRSGSRPLLGGVR